MKLIRNAVAVGAIATAALVACSTNTGSSGSGSSGSTGSLIGAGTTAATTGTISMHLTIGNGVNLYALNYTCTGPSAIPAGTVNFGDAQSIEYVLGGITAGSGYQCTLTGFDSNGDSCTGTTTTFTVGAGQVSSAGVLVTCTIPTDAAAQADVNTGSVYFDAAVNLTGAGAYSCPGITAFSIVPAEVIGSNPAQLGLSETGPIGLAADGGPTTSDIIWTASCATPPCGTFAPGATSASPTFVCGPNAEVVTITAQVTNYETTVTTAGPVTTNVCNGVQFTSMTSMINCEGGGSLTCFAPTNSICGTAPGTCTNLNNAPVDPNNCGACGATCTGGDVCTHNSTTNTNSCTVPPPALCTTAGQTGCVSCTNVPANNGVCTPTEAVFVNLDIASGSTSTNAPAAGACYACLVGAKCLDSSRVSNQECGDLTGNFTNGEGASVNAASTCVAALTCTTSSPCVNNANGISFCYCGTGGGAPTACATAAGGTAANGACFASEVAGFKFASTDSSDIILNYTDSTEPSGLANTLLSCAQGNNCTACLQ